MTGECNTLITETSRSHAVLLSTLHSHGVEIEEQECQGALPGIPRFSTQPCGHPPRRNSARVRAAGALQKDQGGFCEVSVSSSRVEYSNIYESLLIFAYFSLHAATTKLLGIEHKSHETYEFFRSYFMGNMGPAAKMYVSFSLCSFPFPSLVRGT